jgi:hypothetical protein
VLFSAFSQTCLTFLFSSGARKNLDHTFRVTVDERSLYIPEPRVIKGQKKKGLILQDTLTFVPARRNFVVEIESVHGLPFRALVCVEYVAIRTAENLFQATLTGAPKVAYTPTPTPADTKTGGQTANGATQAAQPIAQPKPTAVPPPVKKCAVCEAKQNLLRCSRCKQRWYCGQDHQRKDWPRHKAECGTLLRQHSDNKAQASSSSSSNGISPSVPTIATRPLHPSNEAKTGAGAEEDEDIVAMDSMNLVTLIDPISAAKIETAAKVMPSP